MDQHVTMVMEYHTQSPMTQLFTSTYLPRKTTTKLLQNASWTISVGQCQNLKTCMNNHGRLKLNLNVTDIYRMVMPHPDELFRFIVSLRHVSYAFVMIWDSQLDVMKSV